MHVTEVWNSKQPLPTLIRLLLVPLSLLYAIGWELYLLVYRLGFKRAYRAKIPVLVVGNLVTGGSGKSPVVLHVAQVLQSMGHDVVIGCNGYGGRHGKAAALAPDGPLDAQEWGDEPSMIRWLLSDIPLVVGRDRVMAAKLVEERYPDHILLMDDGFQHLPLATDISVILDETSPRNSLCLPAGPYREGRWNRSRATQIIPGQFKIGAAPYRFSDGNPLPRCANLLCALGQPERFLGAIRELGCEIVRHRFLSDHDPLTAGKLWEEFDPSLPVLVTAKDWVKLRNRSDLSNRIVIVAIQERTIEPADAFRVWLENQLNDSQQKNV